MKSKIAVFCLLTGASAFAQTQELRLGDLNFFQKTGSIKWDTQLALGAHTWKATPDKSSPGDYSEYERSFHIWNNKVTYGLSDKWNVGAMFDYAIKNEAENTKQGPAAGAKDKTFQDKGLSDLSFVSAYRLINEKVYLDLLGKLTVGFGDREKGNGTNISSQDGNYKQGHHSLDVGAAVGQKVKTYEWRAGANLDYHMSGDYDELGTGTTTSTFDTDSRLDMSVNGAFQYRPMKKLALGINAVWTRIGEQKASSKQVGVNTDITQDAYSVFMTGLVAKYNVSQTTLLSIGYNFTTAYDTESNSVVGGTASKGMTENNKISALTLGGSFLF